MNITVKKLTPELAEEYIDYFDNRAFSDGNKEKGCYCVWHHWTDKCEIDKSPEWKDSGLFVFTSPSPCSAPH